MLPVNGVYRPLLIAKRSVSLPSGLLVQISLSPIASVPVDAVAALLMVQRTVPTVELDSKSTVVPGQSLTEFLPPEVRPDSVMM